MHMALYQIVLSHLQGCTVDLEIFCCRLPNFWGL